MKRLAYVVPVLGFLLLAFFLFRSLILPPPDVIPSALLNRPAPPVGLAPMDAATPGFSRADLAAGHVTVVNFFAAWCAPCRQESPQLLALARTGVALYGIDETRDLGTIKGRDFLDQYGNPFSRIVADTRGERAIDWGVTGMPETFVIDGRGIIRLKLVGAVTDAVLQERLLPAIAQAKGP